MGATKPKRKLVPRCLVILLATLFLLATPACQSRPNSSGVTLWTGFEGAELKTLKRIVDDYSEKSGEKVRILKVPFNSLQRKLLIASPAKQGPELFIGPHDWIGILKTTDIIAPVPQEILDSAQENFHSIALEAVEYQGEIYSLPLMMDCLVMARNMDLMAEAPDDLASLVTLSLECQKNHPGVTGFSYEIDNLYFSWGFLSGFGCRFFDVFRRSALSLESLKFHEKGAIDGVDWVADLRLKHQLVKPGMENATALDLFLNKKLGILLCGPWNLADIRRKNINYVLDPLPDGPEGASSPFVGVIGLMKNRHASTELDTDGLMKFLSSPKSIASLCQASGRAPTRRECQELLQKAELPERVKRDLEILSRACQRGTPMPNHPAVSAVWEPLKQTLELVTSDQSQAEPELRRATERVRSKIRFMME